MKKGGGSFNVGASSILVIFVLLCLTTFSTLSMISANADYKLTAKAVESAQNYWTANNQAQQVLADIDKRLTENYEKAQNDNEFFIMTMTDLAANRLSSDIATITGVDGTGNAYSFIIPVGETQELYVEFALEHSPAHFRKTAWLLRSTVNQADFEENIDLWDGGEIFFG